MACSIDPKWRIPRCLLQVRAPLAACAAMSDRIASTTSSRRKRLRSNNHDPCYRRHACGVACKIKAPRDSEPKLHERRRHEAPKPTRGKAATEQELMDPRAKTLRSRHADLEHAISMEMARPLPDFLRIRELKRRKLRIRDPIAIRERLPTPAA